MNQNNPLCLLVDDQRDILTLFALSLENAGIKSHSAQSLTEAYSLLGKNTYDLCIADLSIRPGGEGREGLALVEYIKKHVPLLPVIVTSAYGEIPVAVQALRLGAFDFVSKEVMPKQLCDLAKSALNRNLNYQKKINNLIGQSPAMLKLREEIQCVAHTQAAVFISGESGTGKEVVAQLIHSASNRTEKAFVPINCGAISGELIESELFGHRKGAFTGAYEHKVGLFKAADGGTLFLDEIGDLSSSAQIKLLRAIQERAIRPVGSNTEEPVDVRILSASHRNLEELIKNNIFRRDLFFRINVIEIRVPPLRERIGDIRLLVNHFLAQLKIKLNRPKIDISNMAIKALEKYEYPGNVRELENLLESAAILCKNNQIQVDDLRFSQMQENIEAVTKVAPDAIADEIPDAMPDAMPDAIPDAMPDMAVEKKKAITPKKKNAINEINEIFFNEILMSFLKRNLKLEDVLDILNCVLIGMTMEFQLNNQRKSADFLGLSESAFRYRLKLCDGKRVTAGKNANLANELRGIFNPFLSQWENIPLNVILDELEKRLIKKVLDNNDQNQTKASKQLGITVGSLRYRLERIEQEKLAKLN